MPLIFAVSGINFPIGVLLYWLTTNLWTMCQQFYVIRRMPAPGSAAEKALHERQMRKGKEITKLTLPGLNPTPADAPTYEAPKSGQRQQPKGKRRGKATGGRGPNRPTDPSNTSGPQDVPGT
jgi:YidC/Oxa1 family membrane protein insertase